jgi:hypothetical protein
MINVFNQTRINNSNIVINVPHYKTKNIDQIRYNTDKLLTHD